MAPNQTILERFRALFRLEKAEADALFGDGGHAYYNEYFAGIVPIKSYTEKVRLIARLTNASGKSVLDVGSGHGTTACLLEAFGASKVTGLELNQPKVEAATRVTSFLECKATSFVAYDGTRMPFDDGYFDVVITNAALSHVYDIDDVLVEMKRVLKPGGTIYVFEDNNAMHYRYKRVMEPRWQFAESGDGPLAIQRAGQGWVCYRDRRAKMIREWHPELQDNKVEELALQTKGLALDELRQAVDANVRKGAPITVDKAFRYYAPDTGEAMEYPFTPPMLRQILAQHFVDAKIHSAWTGPYQGLKGLIKRSLKLLGTLLPPVMYRTQPIYAVTAKKPTQ